MRRTLSIVLACLVAGAVVAEEAAGARILLTETLDYWSCPTLIPGTVKRLYVVAALDVGACGGITEAEFRIAGFPTIAEGCAVVPMWPFGIPPMGDPFVEGVRIGFPCATSESGVVVLFSFDVLTFAPIAPRAVQVVGHQTPSDPQFPCPTLTLCDPAGMRFCVAPTETWLNDPTSWRCYCSDGCVFGACPPLAVAPGTWSHVKDLYRP